jgi:hypothetical protein
MRHRETIHIQASKQVTQNLFSSTPNPQVFYFQNIPIFAANDSPFIVFIVMQ